MFDNITPKQTISTPADLIEVAVFVALFCITKPLKNLEVALLQVYGASFFYFRAIYS